MDPIWAHTIVIAAATIIGPLTAIMGSIFLQSRKENNRLRVDMITGLIAHRMHPSRPEFTQIINTVPVVFRNKTEVLKAYDRLRALLERSEPVWRNDANFQNLISDMLFEMSKCTRLKFSHVQLRSLNYSSVEYETRDERLQAALEAIKEIPTLLKSEQSN